MKTSALGNKQSADSGEKILSRARCRVVVWDGINTVFLSEFVQKDGICRSCWAEGSPSLSGSTPRIERPMVLKTTLVFISLVAGATAHYSISYPVPRGVYVSDNQTSFCGRREAFSLLII